MTLDNRPPGDSGKQPTHSSAAKWMIVGVWVLLLALVTLYAQRWLGQRDNPNQQPVTGIEGEKKYVELLRNRSGHYLARGTINGVEVVFLIDTGATSVSVPSRVAQKLNLTPLHDQTVSTANGSISVQSVVLDSVAIGELVQEQVIGHINPHMDGNQVLLGMSYLSHYDLLQQSGTLTLSEPWPGR